MAKAEEKRGFMTEDHHSSNDLEEAISGCGCSCFGRRNQERKYNLINNIDIIEDSSWVVIKLKKLKELSEIVAGPNWKNFIRKIGKYCNNNNSKKTGKYMYSPQSYALNFDDEDLSSRFPVPLSTTESDQQRRGSSSN